MASGDADGLIYFWKHIENVDESRLIETKKVDENGEEIVKDREIWRREPFFIKHEGEVTNLCWSPDGVKLASVSMDNSLLIHNLKKTGKKSIFNLSLI